MRWSRSAAADLAAIAQYIAATSPKSAQAFLANARDRADALADFPRRGRVVPELRRLGVMDWRELVFAPYRLIYIVEGKRVQVDAIVDARRDLDEVLLERLVR